MASLDGTIALVTGASRGIGRGVAASLSEAGATVYLTGRTPRDLDDAAVEARALGGKAIPIRCDHRDDAQVRAVFRRIEAEQGRIDVLVNSVFPGGMDAGVRFWELPAGVWDDHAAAVRAHYVASLLAAPLMISKGRGLIVFISSSGAVDYFYSVPYHAAKAATDKLAADMAIELRPHGVAAVSLWPRLTKTERVLAEASRHDLSGHKAATPQLTGRAVAALAGDPSVLAKSGRALKVIDLAREYGFTDVDGTLPDW